MIGCYSYSSENVFTMDSVLAKVDSFEGVIGADVYILSKWQYYVDWIIREIDKKLIPRTLSRGLIKPPNWIIHLK